ncbi:MAG: DUF3955 domain-containing protein [Methanobacteriaceae archaeon]|nr:DUF3955 domain-containing protein [Methanobacteriaceae archaeon]
MENSTKSIETKKFNIWFYIGVILVVIGILLLITKGISTTYFEYMDSTGLLHENFFLIPLSYLCFFIGIISLIISIIKRK